MGMTFIEVPGTEVAMCIHETRRRDYALFAKSNAVVNQFWEHANYRGVPCGNEDDHPVCFVSRFDAEAFCDWLSEKEGRHYRLPTDEEWSYAVGIGELESKLSLRTPQDRDGKFPGVYPWEGPFPPMDPKRDGNYADMSLFRKFSGLKYIDGYDDGFVTTAPVMSFAANKLGIFDLGGNVWEWVSDSWDGNEENLVLRGGDFLNEKTVSLHSGGRSGMVPSDFHALNYRNVGVGFRCVLDLGATGSIPASDPVASPVAAQPVGPVPPAVMPDSGGGGPQLQAFVTMLEHGPDQVCLPLGIAMPPTLEQDLKGLKDGLVAEGKAGLVADLERYRAAYAVTVSMLEILTERNSTPQVTVWETRRAALRPFLEGRITAFKEADTKLP